mmetsp:Transcript_41949/g.96271  ORF Transcript_41949/g.96271 Transcript_41949/m.96271 type:complete len:246 (+) Transcript_41949:71-808(+)|eukprot:1057825-Amphidinium_carterae.1
MARMHSDVEMGHLPPIQDIQRAFVRKVYGTVAVQLCLTAMIAGPIATASPSWLQAYGGGLSTISLLLSMGLLIIGCCARGGLAKMMRSYPSNMAFLAAFTLAESIMVGLVCSMYEVQSVVLCLALTCGAVGALTAFAVRTDMDATKWGAQLVAAVMGLSVVSIVAMFAGSPMLNTLYSAGGALVFAGFLVYDTQLILGNKHESSQRFGIDDYAFAALMIYMDIVRMFIYLLRLLGQDRRGGGRRR